jgi:hypothetical protein
MVEVYRVLHLMFLSLFNDYFLSAYCEIMAVRDELGSGRTQS